MVGSQEFDALPVDKGFPSRVIIVAQHEQAAMLTRGFHHDAVSARLYYRCLARPARPGLTPRRPAFGLPALLNDDGRERVEAGPLHYLEHLALASHADDLSGKESAGQSEFILVKRQPLRGQQQLRMRGRGLRVAG